MKNNSYLNYIEALRLQLHETIDNNINEWISRIENNDIIEPFSKSHPITMYGHLKGTKPVAVKLPDGTTENVKTWKNVAEVILNDCNQYEECHEKLLSLCGKPAARSRTILDSFPDNMTRPIQVDENIFFESYFDTEFLLKMMCERVLRYVGYDYESISVDIFEPSIKNTFIYTDDTEEDTEEDAENELEEDGFTMSI